MMRLSGDSSSSCVERNNGNIIDTGGITNRLRGSSGSEFTISFVNGTIKFTNDEGVLYARLFVIVCEVYNMIV